MKETDKELLMLAAKAAGFTIRFVIEGNGAGEAINYREYEICEKRWEESPTSYGWDDWNPLEDGNDALQLMTKLRISIDYDYVDDLTEIVESWNVYAFGKTGVEIIKCELPLSEDADAATRLAIVTVAAEIGRKLP